MESFGAHSNDFPVLVIFYALRRTLVERNAADRTSFIMSICQTSGSSIFDSNKDFHVPTKIGVSLDAHAQHISRLILFVPFAPTQSSTHIVSARIKIKLISRA